MSNNRVLHLGFYEGADSATLKLPTLFFYILCVNCSFYTSSQNDNFTCSTLKSNFYFAIFLCISKYTMNVKAESVFIHYKFLFVF